METRSRSRRGKCVVTHSKERDYAGHDHRRHHEHDHNPGLGHVHAPREFR